MNCKGIKSLEFKSGIHTINDKAFRGCDKLKEITLPETVLTIGKRVFSPDADVLVKCSKGSYAEKWALENGYRTESIG